MSTRLFVGSLAYTVTDAQLQAHFAQAGSVVSARVIMDRSTGQSKGFGFVEMATAEDAQKVMEQLNNSALEGRNIVVNEARPQEERPNNNFKKSW